MIVSNRRHVEGTNRDTIIVLKTLANVVGALLAIVLIAAAAALPLCRRV